MPEMQTAFTVSANFSKLKRSYYAEMIHMKGNILAPNWSVQSFFLTSFEKKAFRVFNFEEYVT